MHIQALPLLCTASARQTAPRSLAATAVNTRGTLLRDKKRYSQRLTDAASCADGARCRESRAFVSGHVPSRRRADASLRGLPAPVITCPHLVLVVIVIVPAGTERSIVPVEQASTAGGVSPNLSSARRRRGSNGQQCHNCHKQKRHPRLGPRSRRGQFSPVNPNPRNLFRASPLYHDDWSISLVIASYVQLPSQLALHSSDLVPRWRQSNSYQHLMQHAQRPAGCHAAARRLGGAFGPLLPV